MYGTEKLKEALLVLIRFSDALDKRLDDGKLSLVEGITLVPKLTKLPQIIADFESIKNEFLDLDEIEKAEINQFIKDELDLVNDKVEDLIESVFDLGLAVASVVDKVRELKDDDSVATSDESVGGGGQGGDPDPDGN